MKIISLLLTLFCITTFGIPAKNSLNSLKEDLYQLESQIFYTKHLAYSNTIRERTAFIVAIAGICGSLVTPFKLVKNNPQHRIRTFGRRLAVMVTTLCATTTAAFAISFLRPVLWYKEHKRDTLKKKIFDLQKN